MKELQLGEIKNTISNIKKYGDDALVDIPRMHIKQIQKWLTVQIDNARMNHHLTAIHAQENGYPENQWDAGYYEKISSSFQSDLAVKNFLEIKLQPKPSDESDFFLKQENVQSSMTNQKNKEQPFIRLLQIALYCHIIGKDITRHNQNSVIEELECSIRNKSGKLKRDFDAVSFEKVDVTHRFYESDKKRVLSALKKLR